MSRKTGKYGKYILTVAFMAALLCDCASWPVSMVKAMGEESEEKVSESFAHPEEGETAEGFGTPADVPAEDFRFSSEGGSDGDFRVLSEVVESGSIQPGAGGRVLGETNEETAEWIGAAGEELAELAAERDIMALVYLSDEYPVRRTPSYEGETEVMVLSGQMVNLLDVSVVFDGEDAEIWYYVRLDYKGQERFGYVPRSYLACSDARFLAWEETYGLNFQSRVYSVDAAGNITYPDIEQFPESYRPALLALKQQHPNWTFAKMNTNLDWETVIANELKDARSLVYKTFPEWAKEGLYDTGTWYYASEAVLKRYMDPRNSLTENAIFQFEQLTYNEEYHTLEAVSSFLNNTFMNDSKNATGTVMKYSYIFWAVGKEEKREVSPFHLAARVLQEQGAGTSQLISGTYPGYEGYYNYFNVGATGTTDKQVIESGLKYAKEHGWSNAYYSILGGADVISANYIKKGQDTLYLQKYNVNPNGAYAVYTHQYMQNISAPTTEALSIKKLYAGANSLNSPFVFKIPVYENMPEEPCGEPKASTNVVLELPTGYSDTSVWLDGVPYEGERRNGRLIAEAPDGNAKSAVVYQYNASGVPTGMYVWSLSHNGVAYTATAEPELKDLLTYHGFSIRITGKTGIRFKTGISTELRAKLTTTGAGGYTLKEYGTLVMTEANRALYPMVKGGTKVAGGMSYGRGTDGTLQDVVFETVDGRYRFTSVLVGLPVEQYKTEFAFRGYIILEKNGVQTTLYGPVRSGSIYELAQRLISGGSYRPGTDAYEFLTKLIGDADALERQ